MKTVLLASALALAAVLPAQAHGYKKPYYGGGYGIVAPSCGTPSSGVYPGYDRPYGHRHVVGYYHWPCWKQPDIIITEQPYNPCYDPCRRTPYYPPVYGGSPGYGYGYGYGY